MERIFLMDAGLANETVLVQGTGRGDVVVGVVDSDTLKGRMVVVPGSTIPDLIRALESAAAAKGGT